MASSPSGVSLNNAPKQTFSFYNYAIVLCIGIGTIAGGMVNGTIGTSLGQPSFLTYFGFIDGDRASTALIGATLGVFFAGALFGTIWQDYVSDRWGRKMAMVSGCVISIVSAALLAGSVKLSMFLVFRFTAGFGSGHFNGIVPTFQTELSPPKFRGLMVGTVAVGISVGYVLAAWIGVGFFFVHASGAQWRIPFALSAVPSILVLCLLPLVPESPRWLVMQGRVSEAKAIIEKLHGAGDESSHEFALLEITQIQQQIEYEKEGAVSWWALLTEKRWRTRVLLTIVVMFMGQSAGIVVFVSYGPPIYASLGFSSVGQLCITAGYVTLGASCAFLSTFFVDRAGRVGFIMSGTILQVIMVSIIAALVAVFTDPPNKSALSATVALFYLFEASYCLLVEGPSFTYVAEIWPSNMRAKGVSLGVFSLYLIDLAYLSGSLYAFSTIGWRYYLVFIIVPIAFLIIFWQLAVETRERSLEEIGALFGDHIVVPTLAETAEKVNHEGNGKGNIIEG